jgi:hypothetical protein
MLSEDGADGVEGCAQSLGGIAQGHSLVDVLVEYRDRDGGRVWPGKVQVVDEVQSRLPGDRLALDSPRGQETLPCFIEFAAELGEQPAGERGEVGPELRGWFAPASLEAAMSAN